MLWIGDALGRRCYGMGMFWIGDALGWRCSGWELLWDGEALGWRCPGLEMFRVGGLSTTTQTLSPLTLPIVSAT